MLFRGLLFMERQRTNEKPKDAMARGKKRVDQPTVDLLLARRGSVPAEYGLELFDALALLLSRAADEEQVKAARQHLEDCPLCAEAFRILEQGKRQPR